MDYLSQLLLNLPTDTRLSVAMANTSTPSSTAIANSNTMALTRELERKVWRVMEQLMELAEGMEEGMERVRMVGMVSHGRRVIGRVVRPPSLLKAALERVVEEELEVEEVPMTLRERAGGWEKEREGDLGRTRLQLTLLLVRLQEVARPGVRVVAN